MVRAVVAVGLAEPLRRAGQLMLSHRFDALPVVDEAGRVVGMVGIKDLLAAPNRVIHTGARHRSISKYVNYRRLKPTASCRQPSLRARSKPNLSTKIAELMSR